MCVHYFRYLRQAHPRHHHPRPLRIQYRRTRLTRLRQARRAPTAPTSYSCLRMTKTRSLAGGNRWSKRAKWWENVARLPPTGGSTPPSVQPPDLSCRVEGTGVTLMTHPLRFSWMKSRTLMECADPPKTRCRKYHHQCSSRVGSKLPHFMLTCNCTFR